MERADIGHIMDPGSGILNAELMIRGGTAITMVAGQEPLNHARVFIRDGRITGIWSGPENGPEPSCNCRIIEARNAIIMPGLINAHGHTAMTLFRGYADDLPLREWLFEKIFPLEAQFLSPDTVYWGTLLGCLEMIASGTTCLADGYFFQDETLQAVYESGLRGLIAQGVIDFPAPGVKSPEKNLEVARRFLEKWRSFSDRITPGIFCHSALTCSERTLMGAMEMSRSFGVPLQIHLSETSNEVHESLKESGLRPVHYLDRLGLISKDLIAAHAIHLDDSEIRCLAEQGAKVVHVPESNMKLCSGVSRVSEMLDLNLKVGLGTDGCASNNNLDLFCEMDTAAKLGKVMSGDPTRLDAKTVLKMATSGGAAVLGLEREIGTLEKGKKADIIVVERDGPHMCPEYDPVSAVVYSATGADVKDVIVNGQVIMKDREFLTLDAIRIMGKVRGLCRKLGCR
jgi:5-methylthioadenosine/S-adenosylhomocysteine deaminase